MHSSTAGSEIMWQAVIGSTWAPQRPSRPARQRSKFSTSRESWGNCSVSAMAGSFFGPQPQPLARSACGFPTNLEHEKAGLHARRGQAEGPGRRGAQSKMHLVKVGRRVNARDSGRFARVQGVRCNRRRARTLVFLVALSDVPRTRVVPLAMRWPAVYGASWDMDSMCQRTLRHLGAGFQALRVR